MSVPNVASVVIISSAINACTSIWHWGGMLLGWHAAAARTRAHHCTIIFTLSYSTILRNNDELESKWLWYIQTDRQRDKQKQRQRQTQRRRQRQRQTYTHIHTYTHKQAYITIHLFLSVFLSLYLSHYVCQFFSLPLSPLVCEEQRWVPPGPPRIPRSYYKHWCISGKNKIDKR